MDYQIFGNLGIAGAALFFAYLIFKAFTDQIKASNESNLKISEAMGKMVDELKDHDKRTIESLERIALAIKGTKEK